MTRLDYFIAAIWCLLVLAFTIAMVTVELPPRVVFLGTLLEIIGVWHLIWWLYVRNAVPRGPNKPLSPAE